MFWYRSLISSTDVLHTIATNSCSHFICVSTLWRHSKMLLHRAVPKQSAAVLRRSGNEAGQDKNTLRCIHTQHGIQRFHVFKWCRHLWPTLWRRINKQGFPHEVKPNLFPTQQSQPDRTERANKRSFAILSVSDETQPTMYFMEIQIRKYSVYCIR